jgi:tRNA modification GTPase
MVLSRLLDAICARGARMARPGEFSERAFHNGKLDLAQAEAIADLIASSSQAAARAAVNSLSGHFSGTINTLAEGVEQLRVLVEAAIDFPDEDVEILEAADVTQRLADLIRVLNETLASSRQGVLLNEGIHIALVGPPNVGKSSLLNALSGEETAIVTDIPGTTRDLLKVDLVLDGLPVRLVDTAGLREAQDAVEEIGVERAKAQAAKADLVLWVVDSTQGPSSEPPPIDVAQVVTVANKIDLMPAGVRGDWFGEGTYFVSAKTGEGLDDLKRGIESRAGFVPDEARFTARARHVTALSAAGADLEFADRVLGEGQPAELVAECLRHAHEHLGEIVGTVTADDLLGKIFAEFCIGK